jgi:methionine sulfoxide reductase heme-binding subunit
MLLWFVNRGTGVVLLALMTLAVILGMWSTTGRAGRGVPRFVVQSLHRTVSLVSAALLVVHVGSAVLDSFVTIRVVDAFVPFIGLYKPVWLGLGTLALDLIAVTIITSLLRHRMNERLWRWLHLASYFAWGVSVAHGLGIGTDALAPWSWWVTVGCAVGVAVAWILRFAGGRAQEVRA